MKHIPTQLHVFIFQPCYFIAKRVYNIVNTLNISIVLSDNVSFYTIYCRRLFLPDPFSDFITVCIFFQFFRFAFAEFFCDWILSLAVFNLSIFFSFAARFDSFSAFSRSRALFSLRASHTLALFLLSSAEFSAILSTPLSYKFFYVCAFIW